MKTIECKRVDLWDGGERHTFGFYIDSSVSNAEIEKAHPHCFIKQELITVFDSLDDVKAHSIRELKKSAWLKLTPQERKALGMLDEPK